MLLSPYMRPSLTVVVVRDHIYPDKFYAPFEDFETCLEGLVNQSFSEPFKILICVQTGDFDYLSNLVASSFSSKLDIEVISCPAQSSIELKNFAALKVDTPLVLSLDADTKMLPDCMQLMVNALRSQDKVDVVSGVTTYGDDSAWRRVAAVVDRGNEDTLGFCRTKYISTNFSMMRSELIKQSSLQHKTHFTESWQRMARLHAQGVGIYSESAAVAHHAYPGISLCHDFNRTLGFAQMQSDLNPSIGLFVKKVWRRGRGSFGNLKRLRKGRLCATDWLVSPVVVALSLYFYGCGMAGAMRGKKNASVESFV